MADFEKLSVLLPTDLVRSMREAVDGERYAVECDVLIEALALLPKAAAERLEVRIVGGSFGNDAKREAALRECVRVAGLESVVRFEPFCDNPAPFYQWADVVTVPSRLTESLGRVAIEGNLRVEEDAIRVHLRSQAGQPFDQDAIDRDIRAVYAMGFFDQVDADSETDEVGHLTGWDPCGDFDDERFLCGRYEELWEGDAVLGAVVREQRPVQSAA